MNNTAISSLRMSPKTRIAGAILLAVSGLSLSAQAAVPKDMLVIGKAADPQTLDPAVTIDNNDWTVTYPAYQRLVQYKTQGAKDRRRWKGIWPPAGLLHPIS